MKRVLIYIALAAVLGLTGCAANDNNAPAKTAAGAPAQTAAAAEDTAQAPVKPAETAADESLSAEASRIITPEDARALIGTEGVTLLDVRAKYEYDEAHIEGAVLLPYDTITAASPELPPDKDGAIIVYCRSGRRSAIAADTLAELGYTNVYDLGGIQDWPYETVTNAS